MMNGNGRYKILHITSLIIVTLGIVATLSYAQPVANAVAASCADVTTVPAEECGALQTLYQDTNGADWSNSSDWLDYSNPAAPCNWFGIICDGGHVTQLQLSANQLTGSIPRQLRHFSQLTHLNLDNNRLIGTVPRAVCDLVDSVTEADFGYNALYASKSRTRSCLNDLDTDWKSTQTVPPKNIRFNQFGMTKMEIKWTAVAYQADGGHYQISVAETVAGPYVLHGQTADKQTTAYLVDNLDPGKTYYIQVRSTTPAHDNQPDELVSDSVRIIGVTQSTQNILLMLYFPADNDLSGYIGDLVERVRQGSSLNPNVQIVLLADGLGEGNSQFVEFANGVTTFTDVVQDEWGVDELNTADPAVLTWFLDYARANYPADIEMVSLMGHGVALAPEVVWATPTSGQSIAGSSPPIPPLPQEVDATPSDVTSRDYLSLIDVGQALAAATNDGQNPFDILFFDQCFQGNLDTLYEVREAADVFIASPNYAWFIAPYDKYLTQLAPATTPTEIADSFIQRYQSSLNNQHPNTIFWLESSDISSIATSVSGLGDVLQTAVQANEAGKILSASTNSQFVDTNQCAGQGFVLAPPDELLGIGSFAQNLQQAFGAGDSFGVYAAAESLLGSLGNVHSSSRTGSPYLAPGEMWEYDDTLTILAPLRRNSEAQHVWRASIYRDVAQQTAVWSPDPSITATVEGTYAFVQDGSWDEFLALWYTGPMPPTVGHWCHYIPPQKVITDNTESIGLDVQSTEPTTADLTWEAASDDNATTYWLYGNGPNNIHWVLRDAYPLNQTAVTIPDLSAGNSFRFRVIATDAAGNVVAASDDVTWVSGGLIYLPVVVNP